MSKQRIILLITSIIGMVATFLPWASVLGISVSGTGAAGQPGDGWLTLGIFAVPLIISIIGERTEPLGKTKFACVVAGVINTIIGIIKITDLNSVGGGMFGVSIGFGLYLLIIAGVGVCVVSFLKLK